MDERERAERLFRAVAAGRTVFFKVGDNWEIIGPAEAIQPGARVTVTQASGQQRTVVATVILRGGIVRGIAYRTARFANRPLSVPRPPRPAQAHRPYIGAPGLGLALPTPSAPDGGCYFCGVPDCTDCW